MEHDQRTTSVSDSSQKPCGCNLMENNELDKSLNTHIEAPASLSPKIATAVVRPKPLTFSMENIPPSSTLPARTMTSPSSPGYTVQKLHSPASSIFERNVQEDILLPQTSPAIPSHIRTENHIPPVLEASSAAITNNELDPDSVEIITHCIHHTTNPAAAPLEQPLPSPLAEVAGMDACDSEELLFGGRALDTSDIRRLSFISFADVVNAEHAESSEHSGNRDVSHGPGSASNSPIMLYQNRSPSPLHSPASSHAFGTSPPTSISTSFKGLDLSPNRGGRGAESSLFTSQRPISPNLFGELNIETMRQALRRTGSGDLSASRSQVSSTTGNDD